VHFDPERAYRKADLSARAELAGTGTIEPRL
jgi:hypothetical protein